MLLWIIGPFTVAFAKSGRFGYTDRWRWLAPISTRFKVVLNRCDMCARRPGKCSCPDPWKEA